MPREIHDVVVVVVVLEIHSEAAQQANSAATQQTSMGDAMKSKKKPIVLQHFFVMRPYGRGVCARYKQITKYFSVSVFQ